MATNTYILGFFLLLAFGGSSLPTGYILEKRPTHYLRSQITNPAQQALVKIAQEQLGVRELTAKNDGTKVEAYLRIVQLEKGQPWCAAFISWVYMKGGYSTPRTGWSPAMFPTSKLTSHPAPADVLGIYFPSLKRIAHVGLVERLEGKWIISIEGNTNLSGSREGDGVYRKRRLVQSIKQFARWLPKEKEVVHE